MGNIYIAGDLKQRQEFCPLSSIILLDVFSVIVVNSIEDHPAFTSEMDRYLSMPMLD